MPHVCAIICEYNPLHSGHAYHIAQARAKTGADFILCLMSGNFVQRGEPAMFDKRIRARAALACGADLVAELPVSYACSGAERFAQGAVRILETLGGVQTLCFGCETENVSLLLEIADCLRQETVEFQNALRADLDRGVPYAKARSSALLQYDAGLLRSPGAILGIEYCRALLTQNSKIKPVAILRQGCPHDSPELKTYPSALAIRRAIQDGVNVVDPCFQTYFSNESPHTAEGFPILYRLRSMTVQEIGELPEISEGLENRIADAAQAAASSEELLSLIKSKRYPAARIKRILMHALLLRTRTLDAQIDLLPPYLHVLGIRESARPLLSLFAAHTVVSPARRLSHPGMVLDLRASDLYAACTGAAGKKDYTEPLIVF